MSTPTETEHHAATPCRALVPMASQHDLVGGDRPRASFLTQLIASDRRVHDYRRTRRTDPGSAATIYGADKPGAHASFNVLI